MKNYTPCPWSEELTTTTTFSLIFMFGIVLSIAVALLLLYGKMSKGLSITLLSLFVVQLLGLLSTFAFAPRGVSIDDKEIILYRYMGKITIPRSEITDIKPFPKEKSTIRLCGIGGCMGNVGLFRNSEIGNFTAYITDPSRSYVIYRRSKRPIVITSVEPLN